MEKHRVNVLFCVLLLNAAVSTSGQLLPDARVPIPPSAALTVVQEEKKTNGSVGSMFHYSGGKIGMLQHNISWFPLYRLSIIFAVESLLLIN